MSDAYTGPLQSLLEKGLSQIEAAPLDAVAKLPARDRFTIIGWLIRKVNADATKAAEPAPQGADPLAMPTVVSVLTKLALSFSHSETFAAFIDNACDITIERMADDRTIVREPGLSPDTQKANVEKIMRHFIAAASDSFRQDFSTPGLAFCEHKATAEGVVCGYYSSAPRGGKVGTVWVNEHPDAFFNDPVEVACTTMHELVHGIEHQVGRFSTDAAIADDVALFTLRHAARATIPLTLSRPYRQQYHERLAFGIEPRIEKALKSIGFTRPPQP